MVRTKNKYFIGMAPIQYSLHYEDYSEHLMSRFGKLLQMQSMVDMTLMCSSHTLRVHKAVLAASSAYFQEVLQKQTGEPLIILKIRFSVLKCLVEFMYCGKTQCLEENLDDLVSAAQFLKIKGLSKVTKEGLGINNQNELPVFTPPVVINRPPQSLIDLHTQDDSETKLPSPHLSSTTINQTDETLTRNNKDMVMRIPFDIEGGAAVDYADPTRGTRPRRGRPSFKRPTDWESGIGFGRATERALLRREQDSRKAIHQLKHLQTRHMQDYMDRVTLSEAVNSICKNENTSQNYLNMDNDLMYMDKTMPSNPLDTTVSYSKETLVKDTITSKYTTPTMNIKDDSTHCGINTAMSQYVNALKNAGLPTDLPILFESGDGSYINVNEQVLLDMVQSSEIQYEVIEQPNIIEKVADPSEIKSIDDLSKSIERGEMLIGTKNFTSTNEFNKDDSRETINSLNAILPDNFESFSEQQNYVVLDHNLQDITHNPMNTDNSNEFSSIENDMQYFTKSMSDDVKNYYEEQQLNDAREMDQFCPTTSLESSFNMSLLDTKSSHLSDNISQQYSTLNTEDLKRSDDCYDFSLQLPQTNDFKEDALDCLISPKQNNTHANYIEDNLESGVQDRDEIINDLLNIESKMAMENSNSNISISNEKKESHITISTNTMDSTLSDTDKDNQTLDEMPSSNTHFPDACDLKWTMSGNDDTDENICNEYNKIDEPVAPLASITSQHGMNLDGINGGDTSSNITPEKCDSKNYNKELHKNHDDLELETSSTLDENIPFAVGLLPLNQMQELDDENFLKRKNSYDMLDDDAKCLKRKINHKKIKVIN